MRVWKILILQESAPCTSVCDVCVCVLCKACFDKDRYSSVLWIVENHGQATRPIIPYLFSKLIHKKKSCHIHKINEKKYLNPHSYQISIPAYWILVIEVGFTSFLYLSTKIIISSLKGRIFWLGNLKLMTISKAKTMTIKLG